MAIGRYLQGRWGTLSIAWLAIVAALLIHDGTLAWVVWSR